MYRSSISVGFPDFHDICTACRGVYKVMRASTLFFWHQTQFRGSLSTFMHCKALHSIRCAHYVSMLSGVSMHASQRQNARYLRPAYCKFIEQKTAVCVGLMEARLDRACSRCQNFHLLPQKLQIQFAIGVAWSLARCIQLSELRRIKNPHSKMHRMV